MRLTFRWGLILTALAAPAAWLAPGCGARTDIEDYEDYEGEEDDAAIDAPDEDGGPDGQTDAPPDVQFDVVDDVPMIDVVEDVSFDVAEDVIEDAPQDVTEDVVMDAPDDAPMDAPDDAPMDAPDDAPIDAPMDAPVDAPMDAPVDAPMDAPVDAPNDAPTDGPCGDFDGDKYTSCDGDCDESDPNINAGAYDFPNGVDDDCDGVIDNPFIACGTGLEYTSQDPIDYARAIDLCQQTTADAMGANKRWGLISAELRLADGTGSPSPQSHAIITSMGTVLGPRANENFVLLSTGLAATPGQPYYQFGTPQGGTDFGTASALPQGWGPTNKAGCPLPFVATAFNPVNLKIQVRTPTNAARFAFDHGFWSSEYPEYACSPFNDLWVVLLKSGASGIANNRNVVFDNQGTPGSVNVNFFDRCVAGPTGCQGTPGFNFCAGGKSELAGTGYDEPIVACNNVLSSVGGSTGWITTEAPMLPGEIITVEFVVWDSSDGIFDSASMVDYFRWLPTSISTPKTFRP
ncbi:MAG: putative metal-binding motif-containing protein [Polyangiaceae bacterium]|nr:putative metal-binding motif-containing protein [Polyangiaceae bacterium]